MSRLAMLFLGPPKIEHDGLPVKLGRRKAIALLAYLAVTDQSHPRDSLVNLLWPELDTTRGRAALRRTLYALKQALNGGWLEIEREEIGLAPSTDPSTGTHQTLWLDVTEFQHLLAQCETHGHPTSQICPFCVPCLAKAVDLVRGEFLAGFSLRDSISFDDWQLLQAETARRELANALERLVVWHTGQHEFEIAAGYARRKLAVDPLDEETHRQLMRLYAWSGRHSAALRQYKECVRILDEQLGVPPQEATTGLYQALQAGQAPALPDEGAAKDDFEIPAEPPAFLSADIPVERPLFVAREQELAQLDRLLELALVGQSRVAFVTGEAGSGKTALIQEFIRRAQAAHADLVVASGNCNAYTGLGDPYLPFREVLELLTGDVEAKWAAGALTREHARRLWNALPLAAQALVDAGPDLIGTFVPRAALLARARSGVSGKPDWLIRLDEIVEGTSTGPGTQSPQQSDLFEQYTRVLQVLARQLPLVLVVDDLQWADLSSISLLFHLGRHLPGSRILVVGAYRAEEMAIGRDGERHPLELVVNEFRRDLGEITVNVGRAASREFVEAFLDSEPNRLGLPFRERLYRQTRGHPLFTIELLRGMQERGDIVRDPEGCWAEGPALDWETLPARVEAAIAERIGRLAQPFRDALQVASVEGEVFTAEVVARVLGIAERDMALRLSRELDRRHRLVRAQSIERLGSRRVSRYRFRNFLFQKYLYDNLDRVERSYLHEDVGNALEQLYRDQGSEIAAAAASGEVAVQLAWHFEEAGISNKAIRYLHQAGDRAVLLSDHQEGVAHLTKGLALLMALPVPGAEDQRSERAQQELALQLSLGMAWMGIAAPEVERAFLRARELCQELGQTSQLCRILGQLSIVLYVQAEYRRARELGEETLSLAEAAEDSLLVALSHWQLGFVSFALGEYTTARDHLNRVLSFYDPQKHHQPFIFFRGVDAGPSALAYDACCLWCLGYPEQAAQRSQEALAMAREFDHPFSLADVLLFGGCMLHAMRSDAKALKQDAEELIQLATETRMPTWLPTATTFRGEALVMLGQFQEGMARIREWMPASRTTGVRLYWPRALHCLARAQAQTGRPQEGLNTLAEAFDLVEKTDERHWEAELYRLKADLLLVQGDEAEAEACLQKAVEVARRQSAKSWELRATTSLARLWKKQGRREEARQVLARIYDWFTEGFDTPDLRQAEALIEELT